VTFGVHFLLKMTNSNTKTIYQIKCYTSLCLPSIEVCVHTFNFKNDDVMTYTTCIDYLNISEKIIYLKSVVKFNVILFE